MSKRIEDYLNTVPDFPKPGINFYDITSVLTDPDGLELAVNEMQALLQNLDFDVIVGLEARGFLFGMPIAYNMHKPFVMMRKQGKLPRETVSKKYDLEYGSAVIEVHKDDLKPGQKVVIVDDLLATGGTAKAAAELAEELGCQVVNITFLLELKGLNGSSKLQNYNLLSVIACEGE